MYKEHFGFTREVFGKPLAGDGTFMSPQQAKASDRLTKALASGDNLVMVTGPVGSGKTMIVEAALDAQNGNQVVARIARIRLGHDEVLELLLNELGIEQQLAGTIQRFTEFKRILKEWEEKDTRVFIVVEDAGRLGADALAELESLTSTGAGGASGASIILMGPPEFSELFNKAELARIRQRTGLRLCIDALSIDEVKDYLRYCLAAAGSNLNAVFEDGAAEMLHRCTGGIQRVIDNLGRAALDAAAESKSTLVTSTLVQAVATQQFDLQPSPVSAPDSSAPVAAEPKLTEPLEAPAQAPNAEPARSAATEIPAPIEEPIPHLIQDTVPGIEALSEHAIPDAMTDDSPATPVEPSPAPPPEMEKRPDYPNANLEPRAPEALKKTTVDPNALQKLDDALRPDTHLLKVLEELPEPIVDDAPVPIGLQDSVRKQPPSNATAETPEPPPPDAAKVETKSVNAVAPTVTIPTLSDSMRIEPAAPPPTTSVGDTQTLKRPNIQALENAKALARQGPVDLESRIEMPPPEPAKVADPIVPTAETEVSIDLPALTLDNSLDERQKEAALKLRQKSQAPNEDSSISANNVSQSAGSPKKTSQDAGKITAEEQARLDKLAADLGNATSLEEIDDMAAETLFGEEFSQIAATVAAMAANDPTDEPGAAETVATEGDDGQPASLQIEEEPQIVSQASAPPAVAPATEVDVAEPSPSQTEAEPLIVSEASAAPAPVKPTAQNLKQPSLDIDESALLRLEMVKALNQTGAVVSKPPGVRPAINKEQDPNSTATPPPEKRKPQLTPIENQFGASMTQTLEALSIANMESNPDDPDPDPEPEKQTGSFLSRFKRS